MAEFIASTTSGSIVGGKQVLHPMLNLENVESIKLSEDGKRIVFGMVSGNKEEWIYESEELALHDISSLRTTSVKSIKGEILKDEFTKKLRNESIILVENRQIG